MIQYGLTIENQKHIDKLALSKKDGCYQWRGVAYKVVNHKVVAYACKEEILQSYGHFNVVIGNYSGDTNEGLRKLKTMEGLT